MAVRVLAGRPLPSRRGGIKPGDLSAVHRGAVCRGEDAPALADAETHEDAAGLAERYCGHCPVAMACMTVGRASHGWGVWGGALLRDGSLVVPLTEATDGAAGVEHAPRVTTIERDRRDADVAAVGAWLDGYGPWSGTVSDLLGDLAALERPTLPSSASGLSAALRSWLADGLRARGVVVERVDREGLAPVWHLEPRGDVDERSDDLEPVADLALVAPVAARGGQRRQPRRSTHAGRRRPGAHW